MTERQADMAGDTHDDETTEVAEAPQDGSKPETQEQPKMIEDWKAAIAERDGRITELEAQVAEAAKSAETAEALRGVTTQLKEQGESDRIEFELRLAGVRNVKAARAVLDEHGSDVAALKEAEPWLFLSTAAKLQEGKTGLPNAGTSTDEGKTMARWRRLAGLDDES